MKNENSQNKVSEKLNKLKLTLLKENKTVEEELFTFTNEDGEETIYPLITEQSVRELLQPYFLDLKFLYRFETREVVVGDEVRVRLILIFEDLESANTVEVSSHMLPNIELKLNDYLIAQTKLQRIMLSNYFISSLKIVPFGTNQQNEEQNKNGDEVLEQTVIEELRETLPQKMSEEELETYILEKIKSSKFERLKLQNLLKVEENPQVVEYIKFLTKKVETLKEEVAASNYDLNLIEELKLREGKFEKPRVSLMNFLNLCIENSKEIELTAHKPNVKVEILTPTPKKEEKLVKVENLTTETKPKDTNANTTPNNTKSLFAKTTKNEIKEENLVKKENYDINLVEKKEEKETTKEKAVETPLFKPNFEAVQEEDVDLTLGQTLVLPKAKDEEKLQDNEEDNMKELESLLDDDEIFDSDLF